MRISRTKAYNESLSQVQRTAKIELPLVLFITSDIVCISATLYGAVETLEVNASTVCQHIKTMEEMDWSPILLLNRTPNSSSDASSGSLRPL